MRFTGFGEPLHEIHPPPASPISRPAQPAHEDPGKRLSTLPVPGLSQVTRLPLRPALHQRLPEHPWFAFFCSNRYSNQGCGRTFAVYWDDIFPYCSLRPKQLFKLLLSVARGNAIASAQKIAGFPFTISTAYRWVKKWRLGAPHIRSRLCLVRPPPAQSNISNDRYTLQHLESAFPYAHCPLEAFQNTLQTPLLP